MNWELRLSHLRTGTRCTFAEAESTARQACARTCKQEPAIGTITVPTGLMGPPRGEPSTIEANKEGKKANP